MSYPPLTWLRSRGRRDALERVTVHKPAVGKQYEGSVQEWHCMD